MQTPEEPFDVKAIEKNSSLVFARRVSCWRTRYHRLNRAKVVLTARYTCETVNPDTPDSHACTEPRSRWSPLSKGDPRRGTKPAARFLSRRESTAPPGSPPVNETPEREGALLNGAAARRLQTCSKLNTVANGRKLPRGVSIVGAGVTPLSASSSGSRRQA